MGSFGRKYLAQGVVFMRPSRSGSPVGWGVRRYTELGARESQYLKNKNSELLRDGAYVFGLDKASRSNSPVVYVVEGEIDCMALRLRGSPPVVAVGSSVPTKAQAQIIERLGMHPVFILDADNGQQGFDHAASIAEICPSATFMPLTGDLDPDSFVRERSTEELLARPRYSSLEAQMFDEEAYDFSEGRWRKNQRALARKYMERILEDPFITNEEEVYTVADLAEMDADFLRSWLFQERNRRSVGPDPMDLSGGPLAPA
jgi:DNA primase